MMNRFAERIAGLGVMVPTALFLGLGLGLAGCASKSATQADDPLGLDPQTSPAALYVEMAEEYYNRGQAEIAFRRAQQAIEADKNYAKAHAWLAFMYEEMGKADLAAAHYGRAVKLAPKNADILYAAGAYLCRQKQYDEAEVYFKRALDNPLYTSPWIAMSVAGDCAASAGNLTEAERYYRDAIAANPSFGPALVKLAGIEMKRGNAAGAKVYIDRYFQPSTMRTPAIAQVALGIGVQAERQLGNRTKAAEYETVLRTNFPDLPETGKL